VPHIAPHVFHDSEIDWDRPLETAEPGTRPPEPLVAEAERTGARRKKLVRGECGFFMNRSVLPADFKVPAHEHDHAELLVVVRGGCSLADGVVLGPDDAIVIHANTRYGFTCGPNGMEFLTIRTAEAGVAFDANGPTGT